MFRDDVIQTLSLVKTPFYYYDLRLLQNTLNACRTASDVYGFHVHYAMKANFNNKVLEAVRNSGLGVDCVSGNEVVKAIEMGFESSKIVFAGVGKSDEEIIYALKHDISCFNVESVQEIEVINVLAKGLSKIARIAIRINPNIDAHTHHHITTGLEENKFGINQWELPECIRVISKSENIWLDGVHVHVGSQITDMNVFKSLCVKINEIKTWLEERGFNLKILNVGGGFGIDYYNPDMHSIPDFEKYFEIFDQYLERKPGQDVHFELGRALVAQCGSLISRVLYVKKGIKKHFLVLDAGMTELMRPALYQAYHKIENLSCNSSTADSKYDVVGPICETTDCFGKEVEMPESKRGDLVAIRSAGAYGEVMASRYNLRQTVSHIYSTASQEH